MLLITDTATVAAFWEALEFESRRELEPYPLRPRVNAIIAEAAAKGWVGIIEAEMVLADAGLAGGKAATRETLEMLGAVPQVTYAKPGRAPHLAIGRDRVSAIDLASVLMRLKEAGLAVDPGPLCAALAPAFKGREFLTEPELAVYWYARERRRIPLVVAVGPNLTSLPPDAKRLTADGYRAELFQDDAGAPIALRVTAPRRHQSKPRLSLVA